MSNTQRGTFAMMAAVILLGMMFSSSASIILWLPVIGLSVAATTGVCYGEKVVGLILDKLNIPR